jgi:hypothetical protein
MVKPRQADSTLKLVDEYCRYYRNLFSELRSFEAFTHLHTVANVVVAQNWTNHERIKPWPNVWDVMVQR